MTDLNVGKDCSPRVSVIVTTYNRVELFEETLDSILSQTFTDFEVIVVDNMSEDGTSEYMAGITDPRVRYFRNPNFGIIAVNRNFGIKKAKGEFIAFCDDDDLWVADKLRRQLELMGEFTDVALCYTHAEVFVGKITVSTQMNHRNVYRNHFFQLLRGGFFPNSSVLIRTAVFNEIGLLTEAPLLREDYQMWLRVAKHYRLMGIDSSLIRYRMHSANVSSDRASETLRAIRTLRSVAESMNIPFFLKYRNICFQYSKFLYYVVTNLKFVRYLKGYIYRSHGQ